MIYKQAYYKINVSYKDIIDIDKQTKLDNTVKTRTKTQRSKFAFMIYDGLILSNWHTYKR